MSNFRIIKNINVFKMQKKRKQNRSKTINRKLTKITSDFSEYFRAKLAFLKF